MKKVLLSAIFMAFVTCVFAQSVTLPNPEPNWLNKHLLSGTPIGQDDENLYYLFYSHPVTMIKPKSYTDHFYIVDKESMHKTDIAVTTSNLHAPLDGIVSDNGIIALYESLSKKGDQLTFTIANLDKSVNTVTLGSENSVSTTANPKFWPEYKIAKSPNGKLLAAVAVVTGKNSQLENMFAVVVNNEGEFVWSGTVSPQFGGKSFSIGDLVVDNNGVLYLPAYTCQVNGKNISDVQFMMIKATDGNTETFTEGVTFGTPQDFTAKMLSNGNVVVAGYYTEATTNTATNSNGYYFYTFDTGSDNFSDVRNFKFSDGYVEKAAWARFSNILGNQQYSIKTGDIFELENGSVVLCGEHRFVKAIYDPNMKSWSYQMLTKNILVSTLQPDGNANFTMVEKQQTSSSSVNPGEKSWINHFISYSAFAHHNDMYFLFNDDPRNFPYPGQGVVCAISSLKFKDDKWVEVLMRLTPDQKLTQQKINDSKELLRKVEFFDGEHFYTSGIGQKEFFLTKFSVDF